ncbi:hypothetical protein ACJ41O_014177 [Fusarium nematophilum]
MASSHFRAIPPSTATALSIALDPTSPLPFLSSPSLSTIVNLPPKRPIIWSPHPQAYARPGILRSDFLGTSHPRVLTALLVQVTGEEPTRLQQPVAAPQLHRPLAAPQAQQRHPASIPTIVITSPEPEPQPEAVQEMDTDLPEIEPLNQDELELFPGLIHPDARQNMSQEDSYCWHEINRQMDEPLMTNEELADLVDEFYG